MMHSDKNNGAPAAGGWCLDCGGVSTMRKCGLCKRRACKHCHDCAERAALLAKAEAHDRDAAAYLARFNEFDAAGQPGLAAKWARLEAIAREQAAEARGKAGAT